MNSTNGSGSNGSGPHDRGGDRDSSGRVARRGVPVVGRSPKRTPDELIAALRAEFGAMVRWSSVNLGDPEVVIAPLDIPTFFARLKGESGFDFALFLDVTAIDWMDRPDPRYGREERFELVYHLMSLSHCARLRVRVPVAEEDPEVPTVTHLWPGADFMEREVWDMYGIRFKGHPNLRRILLYDEFVGYPLRKDYPVQGKQPRVRLLHPEVRNTSLDMQRPTLVSINKRSGREGGPRQG